MTNATLYDDAEISDSIHLITPKKIPLRSHRGGFLYKRKPV